MSSEPAKKARSAVRRLVDIGDERYDFALSEYDMGLRQTWHRHDDFVLAMTLSGYVREQVGTNDTLVKPLSVGIKPSGVRHTDHFWDNGVRVLRIALSAEFEDELRREKMIAHDWRWDLNSAAARPFLRLAEQALNAGTDGFDAFDGVCDVLASMSVLRSRKAETRSAPLWLDLARRRLDDSFSEGTRLSELAVSAGSHPVYFARKFREYYGCSVGRYVRQLQFRQASQMISSGRHELAEVAVATGFSDQAHLTRTFACEFGMTPARFRRLLKK